MVQIRIYVFMILALAAANFSCNKENSGNPDTAVYYAPPIDIKIKPGLIDEASGMVASAANPNQLWIELDSGNPNDLFLLSDTGGTVKKINIKSATNRDWEDISFSPAMGSNPNLLYLADIGDNGQNSKDYIIYRFPEPKANVDTVYTSDKIRFKYPDGSHDAEAMLVDPTNLDIYIFTKRDDSAQVYRLPYPQDISGMNVATKIASLEFTGVVGAGMSTKGDQFLLKTYSDIYYWQKPVAESIESALKTKPAKIPYMPEVQGEAICFGYMSNDFYTISERPEQVSSVDLRFYKRQ